MNATIACVECKQKSQDGIFEHLKSCSGYNLLPKIGTYQRPPAMQIKFDSKAEQEKFMRNLTDGYGLAPTNQIKKEG